uniref:BRO1 domain-containing protein n=1 Tax=Meloidogyne hapla TaxID=6305 RepID=A0A1I8B0H6_MELHA
MTTYKFLLPFKTTKEVDIYKPLKTYIDSLSELSEDVKSEANYGLIELNRLRKKACCQPLDKHQSSLDVITRYYDQLGAFQSKLPIKPTPISFKWKDAFGKSSRFVPSPSFTFKDFTFERVCVLFNCGALMSNIASTQQMNTDEELKSVAKMFQQSAGIFSKLKGSVSGESPSLDLTPDALSSLSLLMVAQAQEAVYVKASGGFLAQAREVFYVKASRDKMEPASLMKIAAQCSEMYNEALTFMSKDSVKGMWDKEWLPIITGKGMAFGALAQFYAAEYAKENQSFGEQISRLKEASKLMDQSRPHYLNGFYQFFTETTLIKQSLESALKDNDFIYHEQIPDFKSLPPLQKICCAKPSTISGPLSPRFKDLFESLVRIPKSSLQAIFDEQMQNLINESKECCRQDGKENDEGLSKQFAPLIQELGSLMNQVQEIKVEREEIEKELKKVRCDMSNDFSKALAETGVVNEEKISPENILNFNLLRDRVESSIKRQNSLMKEVQSWHKKFSEERKSIGGAEQGNFLKELAAAYDAFFTLQGDLFEGTKFYNDLTPVLVRLQQKISDFCSARQPEKEDLMKQVQQNIVSTSGGQSTGKSAPPPRPPPPVPPPVTHNQTYQTQAPISQMQPQQQLDEPIPRTSRSRRENLKCENKKRWEEKKKMMKEEKKKEMKKKREEKKKGKK